MRTRGQFLLPTLTSLLFLSACGSNSSAPVASGNPSVTITEAPTPAAEAPPVSPSKPPVAPGVTPPAQVNAPTPALSTQAQDLVAKVQNPALSGGDRIDAMVRLKTHQHPLVEELYLKMLQDGPEAVTPSGLPVTGTFTAPYPDFVSSDPYHYANELKRSFTLGETLFAGSAIDLSQPQTRLRFRVLAAQLLARQGANGAQAVLDFAVKVVPSSKENRILQSSALLSAASQPASFTRLLEIACGNDEEKSLVAAIGLGKQGTLSPIELAQVIERFKSETDIHKRVNLLPSLAQNILNENTRSFVLEFAKTIPHELEEKVAILMAAPFHSLDGVDSVHAFYAYFDSVFEKLKKSGSEAAVRSLTRLVLQEERLSYDAMVALSAIKTVGSAQMVAYVVKHGKRELPALAFNRLLEMETPEADAMICDLINGGSDFGLKALTAKHGFGEARRQAAFRAIFRMRNLTNDTVMDALAGIKGDDSVALIAAVLADSSRDILVRRFARSVLTDLGTAEAQAAIAAHPLDQ